MLDKKSPLPIYYQLREILREKVVSGEWIPGTMIPSERELSEQYEISRMTARQALGELTREGILYREQGKGTFVAERKMQQALTSLTSFSEDMQTRGKHSGGKVLRLELVTVPVRVLGALEVAPEQKVVLLKRLRMSGGEPIALESCFLHFPDVQELLDENFENSSLYKLLSSKYGIIPTRAQQQVEADLCSPREEELLKIATGAPILRNRRITFDQDGKVFEYTESAYRADRYIFQVELDASKEVKG
ncbi:MAG: GntR family transcriptional regulator [Chloroflexi bacterium]|nr:GntR family transcriptional regulator [Chloroflexota bacterium]